MGANAQTSVPTYVAAQVLTAQQLNDSARTGVPVFATTVERDAAFGGSGEKTLAEGQLAYLEDSNVVQYYDGAAWATVGPAAPSAVVQVLSTTKVDTFTMASATFADITGLTVTITPTSASNKILIVASVVASQDVGINNVFMRLVRGATAIGIGTAAGSRQGVGAAVNANNDTFPLSVPLSFLDSPATTSATTYAVQVCRNGASGTVFVNRSDADTDGTQFGRYSSTITVFEVTP